MLCFEITEVRKNGIPLEGLETDTGFRMAVRMDHASRWKDVSPQAGKVIYLEEAWSKEYVTLAQKYPREVHGNLRLRRAALSSDTGELVHVPRYGKGPEWNRALVLIHTGMGAGIRVQFNWGPDAEVLYDGHQEKLVILPPGAGFKLTRHGQLEEDQKKYLAFFWDWDLRLREVPIYYTRNQLHR